MEIGCFYRGNDYGRDFCEIEIFLIIIVENEFF